MPDWSSLLPLPQKCFDLRIKLTRLRHENALQQVSCICVHVRQVGPTNSGDTDLKAIQRLITSTFMLCMTHDVGIDLTLVLFSEEAWFRLSG